MKTDEASVLGFSSMYRVYQAAPWLTNFYSHVVRALKHLKRSFCISRKCGVFLLDSHDLISSTCSNVIAELVI